MSGNLVELVFTYDRVHKEAAGITLNGRIGQFFAPYTYDRIAQLLRCRTGNLLFSKARAYVSVVKTGPEGLRQPISNIGNHIFIAPFTLEFALPVGISALLVGKTYRPLSCYFHGFNRCYNVFNLGSIGANILNCRRSNLSRNEREVPHLSMTSSPFSTASCPIMAEWSTVP